MRHLDPQGFKARQSWPLKLEPSMVCGNLSDSFIFTEPVVSLSLLRKPLKMEFFIESDDFSRCFGWYTVGKLLR